MEKSPKYKYRIIRTEYLGGRICYSAQKAKSNYLLQLFHNYISLTRPEYGSDTYETTLENAKEILDWHIKQDLINYKKHTIKNKWVVI